MEALRATEGPFIPRRVVLHCSDTPDDEKNNIGAGEIREWHLARGFEDIGYHYVIRRDGAIESGRSPTRAGAHVKSHNHDSLGVCYVGRQRPTEAQLKTLAILYKSLRDTDSIFPDQWFGHYEFDANKFCPGFSMELFRAWLRAL